MQCQHMYHSPFKFIGFIPDVLQLGHELAVEATHGVASQESVARRLLK